MHWDFKKLLDGDKEEKRRILAAVKSRWQMLKLILFAYRLLCPHSYLPLLFIQTRDTGNITSASKDLDHAVSRHWIPAWAGMITNSCV
jgi:hypothetical protein